MSVTPKNKDKRVRFTEPITSSRNINLKPASSSNLVSNKPVLSSTGVKLSTSAKHSKLNEVSELLCVKCNGCMLSDNHDLCVLDFINDVNARNKSKSVKKSSKRKVWKPTGKVFTNIGYTWRPTGRTFTIVGNACPLTRITTTAEVPLRKPTALESDTPKPVVTLVYSRKPKKSKTNVPVSKPKNIKSLSANKKEPSKSWGSIVSDVPSSSLDECRSSKLFSVKFGNDHVAKILGYGDYQIGNVTISRVYYVEGLGHNLFSVGQFYDSNLEVAFRQHTCFIRNLEGVDLLTGSRGNNLYTLSLGDMMASSLIYYYSEQPIRRIHQGRYGVSMPTLTKDQEDKDQYAVSRETQYVVFKIKSLDPFSEDYIELYDLNEPIELRRNQGDDLMPTIEEGEVIEEFRTRNDDLDTGVNDYPSYCDDDKKIHIDFLENMDAYRDDGMGDVIFSEPFLREVGIRTRRFDGLITLYKGDDEVTYQMDLVKEISTNIGGEFSNLEDLEVLES
ncbi:hypothetical protein Tco_0720513 [Tanacetum coccineum]